MKDNLMPVRFLLEKVPGQCDGVIASDPFLLPTKKYPSSISAADQQRLDAADYRGGQERGAAGLQGFRQLRGHRLCSAWPHHSLHHFPSWWRSPIRHDIRSATTMSNLTPDQIHQIGLKEVDRIGAEMLAIAHQEGFPDVVSFSDPLRRTPSTFLLPPSRSWMAFASTLPKCRRSCRSSSPIFLARR